ncbi:hypothetical protein CDEF62S_00955 [Castellaniella defragrans]
MDGADFDGESGTGLRRRQAGAYAIEFALVFVVLFTVVYAILTYGFIFMAQQSLNRAANTGARALLAWADDANGRIAAATHQIAAFSNTKWVADMAGLTGAAGASAIQTSVCIPGGADHDPLRVCSAFDAEAAPGSALVVVQYDYAQAPLIPVLGAGVLSLPVPAVLQARAQVDLGASYAASPEAQ